MRNRLTHGSLFSGIGGFELAAKWAGINNIWSCEKEKFQRSVLRKNFGKEHIIYEDIFETHNPPAVDIISGGFPCQPFSTQGVRRGVNDERYLWPEMLRIIREVKPKWVVGENVSGLLTIDSGAVFEDICLSLEDEGYQVFPLVFPAAAAGAPHLRDRVWIISHSVQDAPVSPMYISTKKRWGNAKISDAERGPDWAPYNGGVYGIPNGVSPTVDKDNSRRLGALGNAIVPQVAFTLFQIIKSVEDVE